MGLIVALDDEDEATGSLFWDDGESIGKYRFSHYTCGFENCKDRILTKNLDMLDTFDVRHCSMKVKVTAGNVSPIYRFFSSPVDSASIINF